MTFFNETVLNAGIELANNGYSVFGIKWHLDNNGVPAMVPQPSGKLKKDVEFPPAWKMRQLQAYSTDEFTMAFTDFSANTLCLVMGGVSKNLFCVDVDDVSQYDQFASELSAAIDGFFDRVYVESTYSNGRHIIFAVSPAVTLPGSDKVARHEDKSVIFETKGNGGLVFIAPSYGYSRVSGNLLTLVDTALSEAEFNTVMEIMKRHNRYEKATTGTAVNTTDGFDENVTDEEIFAANITSDPAGLIEARRYTTWAVENRQAVSGHGGSDTAMTYFNMICWGLKVSPNDALAICQPWNAVCTPPWPVNELRHKIASAWRRNGKTREFGYAIGRGQGGLFEAVSLRTDKNGKIINDLANLKIILLEDPKFAGMAKFNELTSQTALIKPVGYLPVGTLLSKQLRAYIISDICDRYDGLRVREDDLKVALSAIYNAESYNPFREFVESCEWDGTPRVDTLLIDCFGCDDTPLAREGIRNWLIAAYARQVKPGMKFDYALTLTGVEGLGKSGFVKCLFDPLDLGVNGWNVDGMHLKRFTDDKIFVEDSKGKVGIELAEFAGSRKVEVEELKSAITKCSRQVRMAYGEISEQFLVRQVYLVTTNEEAFLASLTGNRRFWIVNAKCCNVFDLLTEDYVRQVWGEVRAMYEARLDASGRFNYYCLELSPEAARIAFSAQQNARITDPWEGRVAKYLGNVTRYTAIKKVDGGIEATPVYASNEVSSERIWQSIYPNGEMKFNSGEARKLASFMRNKLGWRKDVIIDTEGARLNGYIRPEDDNKSVFIPNDAIPAMYIRDEYPDNYVLCADHVRGYKTTPKYWNY